MERNAFEFNIEQTTRYTLRARIQRQTDNAIPRICFLLANGFIKSTANTQQTKASHPSSSLPSLHHDEPCLSPGIHQFHRSQPSRCNPILRGLRSLRKHLELRLSIHPVNKQDHFETACIPLHFCFDHNTCHHSYNNVYNYGDFAESSA